MGDLSKADYNDWASPTVYIEKKSKEIRVCADFSTDLNDTLKNYHYMLPGLKKVFVLLMRIWYFRKLI